MAKRPDITRPHPEAPNVEVTREEGVAGGVLPARSSSVRSLGRHWWQHDEVRLVLLIIAVVFAYQPVWQAGFIWDDDVYVTNNALLTAHDGLWRIWFSFDSPSQYFPLVYTTFRVERALWGLASPGYHWVNILLHVTNALLLWRVLARLEIPGAWLAAAIWALHPVQVESVAWVTELKNVQMGFFFLLSLLAWIGFIDKRGRRDWELYALSLVLYALALCSKTTACTLPAALLLISWLRGERIGWRRVMEIAPFVALGIGMGTLTVFWEHYHQGTQGRLFTVGFPERVLIASRAVWFYLGKLFWPANLIFSYPRWTISPADPLAWLWLIALCALGWGAWWARRLVGRSAIVALAFFVVTLGPVLGFFMLYTFRYSFVADHYQYLACIGPIALVSAGMERLHERIMRRHPLVAPGVCAVLLVLLGFLTWQQSQSYQDIGALWQTTIAKNPDSTLAHNDLGNLLLQQGRTGEAMAQYREVLRIDPTLGETQNNVADILLGQGQLGEAIAHYREALEDNPANPHVQSNLGIALLQEGDSGEAIAHAEQAVELWPGNAVFLNNLAWILATAPQVSLRNGPRAVELATQATLASGSNNPAIIRTLAAAYAETGQFSNAVRTAEEALQLADSQSNLALASTLRREIELYEAGRPYERLR